VKVCNICGQAKDESEFYIIRPKDRHPRLQGKCKVCNNTRPRKTLPPDPNAIGKVCTCCKQYKLFAEFHKHDRCLYGYEPVCKKCKYMKRRQREIMDPDHAKDLDLRAHYKISLAQRNAMQTKQEGKCAICGRTDVKLVIDHNHTTRKVRGLVCNACNSVIGHCHERIEVLVDVAAYLYAELHPEYTGVRAEVRFVHDEARGHARESH